MKELDAARDNLLCLCTAGGQDALTLEVSHLHDLCATSEQDVRERLSACEAQLEKLDKQTADKSKQLKERGAALQWELCSLDQALSYSEPQNNVSQLQQHWHSLQVGGTLDIYVEVRERLLIIIGSMEILLHLQYVLLFFLSF